MVLDLLAGLLGAAAGAAAFVSLLVLLGLRAARRAPRGRGLPVLRDPRLVYNTRVPLAWFNTLCSYLYPLLMDRAWVRSEIERLLAQVPRAVPRIRSLRLVSFDLSPSPPAVAEIALETASRGNDVVMRFHFEPALVCLVSVGVAVPLLTEVRVGAHLAFSTFDGAVRLSVPPRRGPMELRVLPSTAVDCSFGLELGATLKVAQAADLAPLWAALLDWVHAYVHEKVFVVPLEQRIPAPDSRPRAPPGMRAGKRQARRDAGAPRGPRVAVRRCFEWYQEVF
jgi:hypothetical protein